VISSRGLRSPEVPREKAPGVQRIAVLGDSCTFGFVQAGDTWFDTPRPYAALLQDLLDENLGPGRFQVINYGMIGYTTFHGLRMLRREVLPDRPDFIVIRFGWNDLLGSPTNHSYDNVHSPWLEYLEDLVRHSRLISRSHVYLDEKHQRPGVPAHPVPWVTPDSMIGTTRMMTARSHGARPILRMPRLPSPLRCANIPFIAATHYETISSTSGARPLP
jgi:hypothetical protein